MATAVMVFFHSGLTTATVSAGTRFASDSVSMLKQPYLARASLTVDDVTAQATDAAPANTRIAYVQVEEGKAVRYEVNPNNRSTAADTSSPLLSGSTQFECGPGWSMSFLEHAIT